MVWIMPEFWQGVVFTLIIQAGLYVNYILIVMKDEQKKNRK